MVKPPPTKYPLAQAIQRHATSAPRHVAPPLTRYPAQAVAQPKTVPATGAKPPPTAFASLPRTQATTLLMPPPRQIVQPLLRLNSPIQRMQEAPKSNPVADAYLDIAKEWRKEENQEWLKSAQSLGMIAELDLGGGEKVTGVSSYRLGDFTKRLPEGFFDTYLTAPYEPFGGKCAERHCLLQIASFIYAQSSGMTGVELNTALRQKVAGKACLAVNGGGEATFFCAGCKAVCEGKFGIRDMSSRLIKVKTVPKYSAAALSNMRKKDAEARRKETITQRTYTPLYNALMDKF